MYLRCTTCHAAVWAGRPSGEEAVRVACRRCSQSYELDPALTRQQEKIDGAARSLARDEKIDLPGAYSILFGLITLDELREVSTPTDALPARPAAAPAEAPGRDAGGAELGYDPGFAEAVRAGRLTAAQARQRGDHAAYVDALVAKHGISRRAALAVADNSRSLLAAIRDRQAGGTVRVEAPARAGGPGRSPAIAVAVVVLALTVVVGYRQLRSAGGSAELPPVSVALDDAGRVLEVSAPDAYAVLDAYCEAAGCEALDLMPVTDDAPRRRIGVLRVTDAGGEDALRAITIRRQTISGRWIAGEDVHLLEPGPAPAAALAVFADPADEPRRPDPADPAERP